MISGLEILREAGREYPVTKVVWPAVAIATVLSIISGFNLGWQVAVFGAAIILAIIVVFHVVAYIAYAGRKSDLLKYPAIFLIWSFSFSVVTCVGLLLSCFFFDVPRPPGSLLVMLNPAVVNTQMIEANQPPPVVKPEVAANSKTAAADRGVKPTGNPSAALENCLDQIAVALSLSEFQSRARECARNFGP